jgi:hypothetical protein
MEGADDRPDASASHWRKAVWLFGFLALFVWQTWLALGLFGSEAPWESLLDSQPIISGAHPQHLYLGTLGAQALASDGTICVYDPAFAAGYPKTPIFNGSRIAEIVLFIGGGSYNPAAYKVGVLAVCLLVPLLLLLACLGTGLERGATFLATGLGILLAWGPSGRLAIEAGECDLLLGSLAILAHAALLIRFHRLPGFVSWLGLWLTASLVWFSQPMIFPLALPLLLFFYLCVGARHSSFTWHGALLVAQVAALAVNLPWLIDWVNYWWLRAPLPVGAAMLPHRTLQTLWEAPLWGGTIDRGLALVVLGSGLGGAVLLHYDKTGDRTQETGDISPVSCLLSPACSTRLAARLLTLGALGLLTLAFLGISWEPLGQMGTSVLFLPALWFAALPAAHAWAWIFYRLYRQGLWGRTVLTGALVACVSGSFCWREELAPLIQRCLITQPLQIGLGPLRESVVQKIVQHTGPDARILWEDRPLARGAPHWSALLPILTGRAYLGGLDPDAFIEHSWISFIDGSLEGRPIATWSDAALEDYCKRYNVAWISAWSPAVVKRLQEWSDAVALTDLQDDVHGYLFLVKHAPRDFILKGKAKIIHADWHHITLADAVPENGVLVLSLHYQAGLRASPPRVQIEREPCGHDPIGFIRLRVADKVARVTLTWGDR